MYILQLKNEIHLDSDGSRKFNMWGHDNLFILNIYTKREMLGTVTPKFESV
jgi:hypothetical protein